MGSGSPYIPLRGLDALRNYKYQSGEYSWLDLKLNGFWLWCAEQLPMTLAPNLVTLIGTFHLLTIVVLAQIYDPQLLGQSPPWVYFVNAWCLFVYQTMDAVDGKQARRTGSSSPLGQLFDHGCDSLGTTFIAIGLISLLGIGSTWQTVAVLATVQIPFYLCQWEENHVHVLRAQVANFGVTEGQYLSIVLNLATGLFGYETWHKSIPELFDAVGLGAIPLPLPGPMADLPFSVYSVFIGAFFPFILAMTSVVSVAKANINFARALLLTTPLVLQQAMQIYMHNTSPGQEIFAQYPVLVIVASGMLHSHLSNRIIVASVCRLEFPLLHAILIPAPLVIAVNIVLSKSDEPASAENQALLGGLLCAYGMAIILQYAHFVYSVTIAITKHLGIKCFTITKKTK